MHSHDDAPYTHPMRGNDWMAPARSGQTPPIPSSRMESAAPFPVVHPFVPARQLDPVTAATVAVSRQQLSGHWPGYTIVHRRGQTTSSYVRGEWMRAAVFPCFDPWTRAGASLCMWGVYRATPPKDGLSVYQISYTQKLAIHPFR